ncbi:MAG: hypothetical protein IT541_17350, partial [Hyphomicrobiales bacterium]|nr:hypothetical protein [Hyphomicrobiales bacterium]
MHTQLLTGILCMTVCHWAWAQSPASQEASLRIGAGAETATVRIIESSPLLERTGRQLADFIALRTGMAVTLATGSPADDDRGIVFLLARESAPAVRAMTFQPTAALPRMDHFRDDGYAIRTLSRGEATYVICAGKADTGVKYAAHRLMRATRTRNRVVSLPPLHLEADPFFKGRYATPSSVMAGSAPELLQKHYAWENWDPSRIPALADYFDAAGMNGLFLFDSPCRYNWTGNHTSPEQMAIKIRTLARRARELNMSVCLWVHGASNLSTNRFSDLQPRDPEQLKQILEDFDRLAERYGDVIDAVYGHWVDPGGAPPPADITDPQKLQLAVVERLERKAGRKLLSIFSAHGLHWPIGPQGSLPWAGYKGAETLIESGILPKGTSIATPEMRIYPGEIEFARKVRAAG